MKVIIIGGGIGGLATAIALRQRGIEATVFEAAPEIKAVGAGIVMASNAMQVLQRLGVAEKVKANGYALKSARIADEKWNAIQEIDSTYAIAKYGVGSYAIHRAALQKVLLEELSEQHVRLNHKVISVNQNQDKASIKFDNGIEEEGDIVIGADGIKSVVRESIFGKTTYRYSGQTCWRAAVDMPVPVELKDVAYELWGSKAGLRMGIVPVSSNKIYFFCTVRSAAGGNDDATTLKEKLIYEYAEFGNLASEILNATDSQKIIRTDIYDFAPIKRWYQGRVVLIGDAAHATTPNLGQGGCQAVEDAYALAHSLSSHQQVEKAFEAFQAIRYAKAKYVVDTSWQFGKITNLSSSWMIKLRNSAIRFVPESTARKSADKLFQLNY